jgi:hypothetical protein
MIASKVFNIVYRTKMSKALIADASKLELRSPAELKIKLGVTLRTGTVRSVTNILGMGSSSVLECNGRRHFEAGGYS